MKKFSLLLLGIILLSNVKAQLIPNGAVCPNFTVTDTKGTTHTLYDYCDSGKYVVIDFFAYWCGTCMFLSAPIIEDFYKKYGCNIGNVIVLGCESDSTGTVNTLKNFDNGAGLDTANSYPAWPGSQGGSTIAIAYGVGKFPTIAIIGPDRKMYDHDVWPLPDIAALEAAFPSGVLTPKSCSPALDVKDVSELENYTTLYPNPAREMLYIRSQNITGVTIVNMVGQQVTHQYYSNVPVARIETKTYPTGIYTAKIQTKEGEVVRSFMVD